jgi:hypothetical protein
MDLKQRNQDMDKAISVLLIVNHNQNLMYRQIPSGIEHLRPTRRITVPSGIFADSTPSELAEVPYVTRLLNKGILNR